MDISLLTRKLLDAYSAENLNKISVTLIGLYKERQFSKLQKIAEMLEDFMHITINGRGKGFSKLMLLYHPDKGEMHRCQIQLLANKGNYDELLSYSHILKLERLEEIAETIESLEDIDYAPVYEWDFTTDGFRVENESRKSSEVDSEQTSSFTDLTFYDAIKIRQYGSTDIEYPTYYLEDMEEIELASSEISNLEGIQYCIHTKEFNLSDNQISDIEPLSFCQNIEVLDLSQNNIGYIDALSNLVHLRSLNLTNNNITDISSLFALDQLEFVFLTGNYIPKKQTDLLRNMEVQVEL